MRYFSVAEAARRWGLSERSVRNYCAQGRIPGALLTGKTWTIPECAEKPARKRRSDARNQPLSTILREEKIAARKGGIYDQIQVDLTYHSNHIEGNGLTHEQTWMIYELNAIGAESIVRVDDLVETANHFCCIALMKPWLLEEYGNASQPYSFARKPKKALAEARASIATCINALPEEIFFTSGGTESDNWVIKGSALSDSEHRAMITSAFEHHAVLRSCTAIERLGYPVAYLSPTPDGKITPENLETVITDNTRLVSIMFANNEIGSIQPIKELCAVTHAHGALFHTDAVQAVGHIKIDVQELGVDMLSASAHKFNGPKGIGFLYIRKGVELPAYADGGLQEYGNRAGTENVAAIVGMATALKNNCNHLEKNQEHVLALENQLFQELDDLGVKYVRNGGNSTLPGLISLSFPGKDGEAILHRMDLKGIAISTGSACDSKRTEISHVLRAINLEEQSALGTIRVSLGKNNSKENVSTIAATLAGILQ